MKTSLRLLPVILLFASSLAAQTPALTGVVNAGNQLPPGFPNSGIAQGALFDIYGSNLSAAPPSGSPYTLAPTPLPTTAGLAGAVVTISVGGTTVTAPVLFALPTQIGAVMPSNTPVGNGTLTLAYNGKSASTPVTVVQSAFGTSFVYIQYANNGVGMGEQAAVTFVSNPHQAATNTYTAAPGDQMIIWGTGLGATTVAGDSQGAPFGNIGPAPLVFVGGVQSPSVTYWGRSPGSIALDQINFTIPQTAPLGCNVSVIVETMNGTTPVVSNGPTVSLGTADGATCSDPAQPFPLSILSGASGSAIELGLEQQTTVTPAANGKTTTTVASGGSGFVLLITPSQLASFGVNSLQGADYQPSFGSCYVGFAASQSQGPFPAPPVNAGATLTLTPPSGSAILLTQQADGTYASATGTTALPGGTWTFSNGAGSAVVPPLTFSFPVPQQIVWTNQTTLYSNPIVRTSPLTITWTGGDSNGYVDILGFAQAGAYNVGFECAAPTSAGQFTIPSSVLLSLPAGNANLQVSTYAIPSSLGTVKGFFLADNASTFQTNIPVVFK